MPTTLPQRRRVPRDRARDLVLAAALVAELTLLAALCTAAGAEDAGRALARLSVATAPACTAAAIPCALLAP